MAIQFLKYVFGLPKEYLDGHIITIINDKDLETDIEKMLPEMMFD